MSDKKTLHQPIDGTDTSPAAIELDARRMLCPLPVIRTQEKIKELSPGAHLRVTCTDPGVKHDIPAWCRIHGHQLLTVSEADHEIVITILVCAP